MHDLCRKNCKLGSNLPRNLEMHSYMPPPSTAKILLLIPYFIHDQQMLAKATYRYTVKMDALPSLTSAPMIS